MSDEERNNPRILPVYKPWWLSSNVLVDSSWKVDDLRKEAIRRMNENGKVGAVAGRGGYNKKDIKEMGKAELIDFLVSLTRAHELSSNGYTTIVFDESQETNWSERPQPPCYPQVYEGGSDRMMNLVTEAYEQFLGSSN